MVAAVNAAWRGRGQSCPARMSPSAQQAFLFPFCPRRLSRMRRRACSRHAGKRVAPRLPLYEEPHAASFALRQVLRSQNRKAADAYAPAGAVLVRKKASPLRSDTPDSLTRMLIRRYELYVV